MNIENHFYNAKANLETSNEKVAAQDYDSALALLAEAYSHVRQLLEQVFKLKALKDEAASPAGETPG